MTIKKNGIIEVPPELRGLSDEEILELNKNRENRTSASGRPSKKERQKLKEKKEREHLQKIVKKDEEKQTHRNYKTAMSKIPMPKISEFEAQYKSTPKPSFQKKETDILFDNNKNTESIKKPKKEMKSLLSSPPKPHSGRILKGVFGVPSSNSVKKFPTKSNPFKKNNP